MNESTLTQLKIVVERAVRPVHASFTRKRKMREELLAHVTGVFEEEMARLPDERTALERTAERFGKPAELSEQLQATVPASDAIDRWLCGQPGEATLRAATRVAAWNLALGAIVFAAATFLSGPVTAWPIEVFLFAVFSVLLLPAYMFTLTFATEWIRQAWYEPAQKSRFRAIVLTLGWFATTLALFEGVTWLNGAGPLAEDSFSRLWITLWLAASVPWMPWCLAHVAHTRICYHREWASLRID